LSTKNEQLSLLNNEKDGILSIVAHDLRSPFNNIKGLIQLVEITSELNQEQKNYFHKINLSIDRGHQLINDLLDISNFQNDRSKLMIE
jgi:signal transduction histidine kinase